MELVDPHAINIDLQSGKIENGVERWTRYLSDMKEMYSDSSAANDQLKEDDPLIYEVYEDPVPEEEGQLFQVTSIVYPGKIGNEYHMTKGHYHEKRDTAEVYLCLSGTGYLLTQIEEGKGDYLKMEPGVSTYIPPYWAHRTVNVGQEPFVFYGVYPGNAGHDYGSIEEVGFPHLVLEENGEPVIKQNPDYHS
ncbi:MAG: glucose-6-phosphate isomerase family protein [Candidatus Bipolaricaulia bacterium]